MGDQDVESWTRTRDGCNFQMPAHSGLLLPSRRPPHKGCTVSGQHHEPRSKSSNMSCFVFFSGGGGISNSIHNTQEALDERTYIGSHACLKASTFRPGIPSAGIRGTRPQQLLFLLFLNLSPQGTVTQASQAHFRISRALWDPVWRPASLSIQADVAVCPLLQQGQGQGSWGALSSW